MRVGGLMKKIPNLLFLLFGVLGPILLHSHLLQAQTFANNDTVVESQTVSSINDLVNLFVANPGSMTCGQFNDDDGDGLVTDGDFLDCATQEVRGEADPGPPSPVANVCVLLNSGTFNNFPDQFADGYAFTQDEVTSDSVILGTIRSGTLNPPGFADLVSLDPILGVYFTVLNNDVVPSTGEDCTIEDAPSRDSSFTFWREAGAPHLGIFQPTAVGFPLPFLLLGERSSALFDCDNDGDLDSAMLALDLDGEFFINRNVNQGTGLVDINTVPGSFFTGIEGDDSPLVSGAVDVADFNGDGILDVVVVAGEADPPAEDALAICYGDGTADNCGFDCTNQVAFNDFGPPDPQAPLSVEAGDFNMDGVPDNAVVLFGLGQLVYLFNNGNTEVPSDPGFTGNFTSGASLVVDTQPIANALPAEVTSGFFNTDDVLDVAVSNFANPTLGERSNVAVFLSDGAGGILPAELLSFPPIPGGATFDFTRADALEAGDFDHCGGDDLVVLAVSPISDGIGGFDPFKQAHFWQNINEAPDVTIGPGEPTQILINTAADIPATCTDPTQDERSFQWTVTAQPPGSNAVFGTPNGTITGLDTNVSSTFQADQLGNYTLQVTCTDACGLSDTASVVVSIVSEPPPTPTPTPTPLPLTQGACIATLNPVNDAAAGQWIASLLLCLTVYGVIKHLHGKNQTQRH